MENLKERGRQLIEQLKSHLVDVVRANPVQGGLSAKQLGEASGLEIRGRRGENVWEKAIIALIVELVKENRLHSTESLKPLESKYAAKARYFVCTEDKTDAQAASCFWSKL